jgi:alpha-ketoglutarate-dependent taurine dioxygenase
MTEQVLPAAVVSPTLRRPLWFNQAHLFHVTNVAPELRAALLQAVAEEDLPRHAYFGDGGAISDEQMDAIRSAYEASTVRVPWEADDVLVLDNLHVAHGRDPFTGERKVLVAMSDPTSYDDCELVDASA